MTKKTYRKHIKARLSEGKKKLCLRWRHKLMMHLALRITKCMGVSYEANAVADIVTCMISYFFALTRRLSVADMTIVWLKDGPGKVYCTIGRLGDKNTILNMLHSAKMMVEGRIPLAGKSKTWDD